MDAFHIESEIPPGHPEKLAVEEMIRGAFSALPGWRVQIAGASRAAWWVIRIQGPHFRRALVVEWPDQQNARDISALVAKALGGWGRPALPAVRAARAEPPTSS